MTKIRIGIELDHVIRNINKQIVKYYQQDIDESIDLDEVNYKDDVLNTVCKFQTKKEVIEFLYETYPLEIFGHASQMDRTLSRDLNLWLKELTNQEDYDVDIFFYSLKEYDITIQSSYFFLSKIGSRVRKVIFPKSINELKDYADILITANNDVVDKFKDKTVLIRMDFNNKSECFAGLKYDDFKSFLNDKEKLNKIIKLTENKCEERKNPVRSLLTWMYSLILFLQRKIGM